MIKRALYWLTTHSDAIYWTLCLVLWFAFVMYVAFRMPAGAP